MNIFFNAGISNDEGDLDLVDEICVENLAHDHHFSWKKIPLRIYY